jgi:tRNA G37 N-methylase Trm5
MGMEQNINLAVHDVVKRHIKPQHICIDATCGNGHDTLFLAQLSNHVFAFDIQAQAVQSTAKRLAENDVSNVTLFHQSHDTISDTIHRNIDIVMYNLGYLPYGDRTMTTTPETTVNSLKQVLSILALNGLITITIYVGHDGGLEESQQIEAFVKTLDKHDYTIVKYEHINRKLAPYAIFIERIR